MILFKSEICLEVLVETGIGKLLKYFIDYCKVYSEDLPALGSLQKKSESIYQKWNNYVLNTIFDDKKENVANFQKNKAASKGNDIANNKSGSKIGGLIEGGSSSKNESQLIMAPIVPGATSKFAVGELLKAI